MSSSSSNGSVAVAVVVPLASRSVAAAAHSNSTSTSSAWDAAGEEAQAVAVVVDDSPAAWRGIGTGTGTGLSAVGVAEAAQLVVNAVRVVSQEEASVGVVRVRPGGGCEVRENADWARDGGAESGEAETATAASVAAGMGAALCWVNKQVRKRSAATTAPTQGGDLAANHHHHHHHQGAAPRARIVIITATRILPQHAVPALNAAFAAQKAHVAIDVLDCTPERNAELVQVAYLTQGLYVRPSEADVADASGLAGVLLAHFVADAHTRRVLVAPPPPAVDLRAVCFAHDAELLSEGFVCSVCLSVFCTEPSDRVCPTCKSRIQVPLVLGSGSGGVGGGAHAKKVAKRPAPVPVPVATTVAPTSTSASS